MGSVCFKSGKPGKECWCLIAENHVVLCDAFREFWARLLETTDAEMDLEARALAESVAERRGDLHISRRWAWHKFSRRAILRSLETIQDIYIKGTARLVLLC